MTDPAHALDAASRVLAPDGTLLIVDFAAHGLERLRTDHAHSHLGFTEGEVNQWFTANGLKPETAKHFLPPTDTDDALTVTLWSATKPQTESRRTKTLEVSS